MTQESLIEFPSELSIKAMGIATQDFASLVGDIVKKHLDPGACMQISTLPSSKGKYVSVRVRFVACSQAQLEAIYADLHAEQRVLFTL